MTKKKELKPLIPADPEQCQAEKSNGVNFMTMGGRHEMIRCKNKPSVIATEAKAGEDGRKGSMSLCESCLPVMIKQMGATCCVITPIEKE